VLDSSFISVKLMSLWQRLLQRLRYLIGLQRSDDVLHFDQTLINALQDLAELEHRPKDAVAADLLFFGIAQRKAAESKLGCWQILSPREQQVTALICLNYTNAQIAARLSISPATASTHVRNILLKFDLHSKTELRQLLADWDFSAWQ
jgi:DNA-binding CsgD family transcriptional regulator